MQQSTLLTDRKRSMIFINIVITCVATSMLATALTTALPSVIEDLQISVTTGQWLTSGYSLAMGIVMPLTAFLITRIPTRRLYLSGLGIFIAGLLLSILAPSFPVMMISRILQACGNGILTSMAQVIILTIYPAQKRGSAMGWYGLSIGAAPVIAPTIAGLIVDWIGWRGIFILATALIAIALLWACFVLDDVLDTTEKRFDTQSFVISIFAFGGITLGIGNIGSYPFVSPQVLLVLLIGIVAAVLFVRRQLHLDNPFLELRILKEKDYTISVLGSMLLYLVMMGSSILMPLYIQTILGHTATYSGLVVLPGSLAMAIISPFAGRIYDKLGIKLLFVGGSLCMLLSNISLFFITTDTPVLVACLCNVIRNISIGCLMMPLVTWGTGSIRQELTAHGTALLTSLRTMAGAIGTAIFVGIMNSVAASLPDSTSADSMMRGFNVAFLCMSAFTLILLLLGIIGVKKKKVS